MFAMRMSVYKITNKVNGKAYVGITSRKPSYRFSQHFLDAIKNNSPYLLHQAMRKYGRDAFSLEVLCVVEGIEAAHETEKAMIAAHGTHSSTGRGYNRTIGGEGVPGLEHSEEARRRNSEGQKRRFSDPAERAKAAAKAAERWRDPEQRRKMVENQRAFFDTPAGQEHLAKGAARLRDPESRRKSADGHRGKKQRPMSAETKAKLSAAHTGRRVSDEGRARMRAAATLRNSNPEWRRRHSESLKGKKRSDESRDKQSASMKGRPKSAEHRAKIAEAARNASPEVRQRRADAIRAAYAKKRAAALAAAMET